MVRTGILHCIIEAKLNGDKALKVCLLESTSNENNATQKVAIIMTTEKCDFSSPVLWRIILPFRSLCCCYDLHVLAVVSSFINQVFGQQQNVVLSEKLHCTHKPHKEQKDTLSNKLMNRFNVDRFLNEINHDGWAESRLGREGTYSTGLVCHVYRPPTLEINSTHVFLCSCNEWIQMNTTCMYVPGFANGIRPGGTFLTRPRPSPHLTPPTRRSKPPIN